MSTLTIFQKMQCNTYAVILVFDTPQAILKNVSFNKSSNVLLLTRIICFNIIVVFFIVFLFIIINWLLLGMLIFSFFLPPCSLKMF